MRMKNPYKKKKKNTRTKLLFFIFCTLTIYTLFFHSDKDGNLIVEDLESFLVSSSSSLSSSLSSSISSSLSTSSTSSQHQSALYSKLKDQCSKSPFPPTSFKEERPKDQWSKPIWVGMFHHSFPDDVHKNIMNSLTSLTAAGKSFYISIKNQLRHCDSKLYETVSCMIGEVPQKKFESKFYSKYIMIVRNPMTFFPSAANVKNAKYHGQIGQTPIEEWREIRDTWIDDMMTAYRDLIIEWKESSYDDGMFLVYEDLMDVNRGPDVIRRIARFVREAGFDTTVEDEDMSCLWYKSVGDERIGQYIKNRYDYNDYVPGFTKEQQEMMMRNLKELMVEVVGDHKELAAILKRYVTEIRDNTIIDRKWNGQAAKKE